MLGTQRAGAPHGRARRRLDHQHRVDRRAHRRRRADRLPRCRRRPSCSSASRAAIDLADYGIRVNCIAPGHIPTAITNYDMGPVIRFTQPLQRHGRPERRRRGGAVPRERPVGPGHRDRACRSTAARWPGRRRAQMREAHRCRRRAARETAMPADLVIRGGTVVDGSGAPGRAADVAITDGVIREIGPNLRRRARARRRRLRRRARVHRHPHALRRAGVLGSRAAADVVPRRHHGRRRQLRLHRSRRPAPSTTT